MRFWRTLAKADCRWGIQIGNGILGSNLNGARRLNTDPMLDVICTTNPLKMRTHLECCIWAYIYS